MNSSWKMTYGATPVAGRGVEFRVWAPKLEQLSLKLYGSEIDCPMQRVGEDFECVVAEARAGDRYSLVTGDGREHPDPVSRFQPDGVHGCSEIVDPDSFAWSDASWNGIPLTDYVLYELHVGTFTPEGTFESSIGKLPYLKDLGITAIELMPVPEFPGGRNWGYDGVDFYAPHSAYGGPSGLKRLVDACHAEGFAVVLDVVYNHVGPEGNYLGEFGPYFTDRYGTPWGPAINYDGPGSDGVRRYFIENALYWLTEYHVDALRLDAVHGIFDFGARHVLQELGERFHEQAGRLNRKAWLIAESDLNDVRVIRPAGGCGYGMDAQWHDEFHHVLISRLTKAERGFLAGFGKLGHIAKAITDGFVHDGGYSPYRKRHFGSSSKDEPGSRFVAFIQNHDQIANTAQGMRLAARTSIEQQKLVATLLLCSPYLPLLFMGEEFADTAPFLYFTSHGDPGLAKMVTEGRQAEFGEFADGGEVPDPQAAATFEKSKITWGLIGQAPHSVMLRLYRDLIALRKRTACLNNGRKDLVQMDVSEDEQWLRMKRGDPAGGRAIVLCNFGDSRATVELGEDCAGWELAVATSSASYGGQGQPADRPASAVVVEPYSAVVYTRNS